MLHHFRSQSRGRFLAPLRGKATAFEETATPLKPSSAVPGPRSYPIIGALPYFIKHGSVEKRDQVFDQVVKDYGMVARIDPLKNTFYIISHPDDVEYLYRLRGKNPKAPSREIVGLALYFGDQRDRSVAMAEGEHWRRMRVPLQKELLVPKAADNYLSVFAKATEEASMRIPFYGDDLEKFFPMFTFEVMGRVLFNKPLGALRDRRGQNESSLSAEQKQNDEFIQKTVASLEKMAILQEQLPFWSKHPWNSVAKSLINDIEFCIAISQRYVKKEIEAVRKGEGGGSYIERLIKNGVDEQIILDNVSDFLFAGVDTTANTLMWNLTHLVFFPEVQEKVYKELSSVLKGRTLLPGDSENLPYLKSFIHESFRLNSTSRNLLLSFDEDIVLKGYNFKKGCTFICNSSYFNKDPNIFENPDQLIPERWLPEAIDKRKREGNTLADHPFLSSPFGFGSRVCIGHRLARNESYQLWSRIVQDYRLELSPPNQPYPINYNKILITPKPVPKVKFIPRN